MNREMTDRGIAGAVIEAHAHHQDNKALVHLGHEMFRMYTEMGFPPDMFVDELKKRFELPQSALIYLITIYQNKFIEHRRKAGAEGKNLDKARAANRRVMAQFIKSGELGVY